MPLKSLRGRSILIILAIYSAVGLLAIGAFTLVGRRVVEHFGRRFAESHAALSRDRILAPLQRELALARKLADSPTLRAWIREEDQGAPRAAAMEELESFRRIFADHSYFFVVDQSRHYYFNNARNEFRGRECRYTLDPKDPTMAWYDAAMGGIQDYALHVDSSEQLGLLKVWINVAVWDQGRKVGLTGTGLELTGFLNQVVQSREQGVQTLLVDRQGVIQAHPDASFTEFNARMKDETQRRRIGPLLDGEGDRNRFQAAVAELVKDPTRVETLHLQVGGHRTLASLVYIREIDWIAVVLVDPGQVVGLKTFLPFLAILLAGLLLTIALVSFLLNRVVLAPLGRLTASAQAMAAGRYDLELPGGGRDEIGSLTLAFNRMATVVRDHMANLEEKVLERTRDLREAHAQLAESNRKVMDSLAYAQMIQRSLVPGPQAMAVVMPDHFLMDRPRDLVGGDFFSLFTDGEGFLLAVADCTGHGVPGAFMTMCARTVLDQLLRKWGPEDPARLLGEMNRAMKAMLHQDGTGSGEDALDNGLEMALLRVLPAQGRVRFASARLPLWVGSPAHGFREYPGDRQSLGYRRSEAGHAFQSVDIEMAAGEACYLFTDGILDQAGGERGFGFGQRRLTEAFGRIGGLPMAGQGRELVKILEAYQGAFPQRDDILVLGFRPFIGASHGKLD